MMAAKWIVVPMVAARDITLRPATTGEIVAMLLQWLIQNVDVKPDVTPITKSLVEDVHGETLTTGQIAVDDCVKVPVNGAGQGVANVYCSRTFGQDYDLADKLQRVLAVFNILIGVPRSLECG